MMRVCNLDTCPAGIATQNPELRKRFAGKPEYVENFMRFIAAELREYMAKLGCKTIDEMVGRSDLLKVREDLSGREKEIDLSKILNNPFADQKKKVIFDPKQVYDFELEKSKDITVLLKQLGPALEKQQRRSTSRISAPLPSILLLCRVSPRPAATPPRVSPWACPSSADVSTSRLFFSAPTHSSRPSLRLRPPSFKEVQE